VEKAFLSLKEEYLSDDYFQAIIKSLKEMKNDIIIFPTDIPCHIIDKDREKFAIIYSRLFTFDSLILAVCREETKNSLHKVLVLTDRDIKEIYDKNGERNIENVILLLEKKGIRNHNKNEQKESKPVRI